METKTNPNPNLTLTLTQPKRPTWMKILCGPEHHYYCGERMNKLKISGGVCVVGGPDNYYRKQRPPPILL